MCYEMCAMQVAHSERFPCNECWLRQELLPNLTRQSAQNHHTVIFHGKGTQVAEQDDKLHHCHHFDILTESFNTLILILGKVATEKIKP